LSPLELFFYGIKKREIFRFLWPRLHLGFAGVDFGGALVFFVRFTPRPPPTLGVSFAGRHYMRAEKKNYFLAMKSGE